MLTKSFQNSEIGDNMNILGISGTPRKGGNSEVLLEASLEPFYNKNWEEKENGNTGNNNAICGT